MKRKAHIKNAFRLDGIKWFNNIIPENGSIDYDELVSLTIKQISRARYVIVLNICFVRILYKNKPTVVIITNYTRWQDFSNAIEYSVTGIGEPSYYYFKNYSLNYRKSIVRNLYNYRKSFYKKGSEFDQRFYFKLYRKKELIHPKRDLFHARWIDYEQQLKNGDSIFDDTHISGLWALPGTILQEILSEKYRKDDNFEVYGNSLFILTLDPKCYYLEDEIEIIGDHFRVVDKIDLNNEINILKLTKYFELANVNARET